MTPPPKKKIPDISHYEIKVKLNLPSFDCASQGKGKQKSWISISIFLGLFLCWQ